MYFRIYEDDDGYWRWHLRARNHEIIAHGEAYAAKDDCLHAINLVKASYNAPVYE